MKITEIVPPNELGFYNVHYEMDNMGFDAAIDLQHTLHPYFEDELKNCEVPIELYCFSRDWDIRMIYPEMSKMDILKYIESGVADTPLADLIEKATREWIDSEPYDMVYPEAVEEDEPCYEPDDPDFEYPTEDTDDYISDWERENCGHCAPQDDFFEYLDRYGSSAFVVAIVEMLQSGELPVTREQAEALWERGGKTC